ncbi:MAG TPA: class II aldolase/adducin family protein [Opitutaceae bacterium]|nr:class II aldolase/adducin family protein [Opitutaceae bacterium]
MRKVITAREAEELLRTGQAAPADAILTPSARDVLRGHGRPGGPPAARPAPAPAAGKEFIVPDFEFRWTAGADPRTATEIERFFNSPAVQTLKERICEIGRRIWAKGYVDGNGGNITVRVGDNLVLCTPTLISKGFMTPADVGLIDLDGRQLAGARKRTSEAMTHLAIMKRQPQAKACVHAHPPHATAFAVAAVRPPTCMIPEAEVFLGEIGYARYQTPGTPAVADEVGTVAVDHCSVIMENHGVIVWGKDVEDAYWKLENTDAYCQTVWIASQLGGSLHSIGPDKLRDLIALRKTLGMQDRREGLKECELCDNSEFRPGVVCQVPAAEGARAGGGQADPQLEALVQQLTDQIMRQLAGK